MFLLVVHLLEHWHLFHWDVNRHFLGHLHRHVLDHWHVFDYVLVDGHWNWMWDGMFDVHSSGGRDQLLGDFADQLVTILTEL